MAVQTNTLTFGFTLTFHDLTPRIQAWKKVIHFVICMLLCNFVLLVSLTNILSSRFIDLHTHRVQKKRKTETVKIGLINRRNWLKAVFAIVPRFGFPVLLTATEKNRLIFEILPTHTDGLDCHLFDAQQSRNTLLLHASRSHTFHLSSSILT
jgi:hypothetical protein